jgi:delta(3,5)-delta(2,4)-dienoyl-CoA isomerase
MAPQLTPQHFLVSTPQPYIAHVEINRPGKMNAFFEAMWLELKQIIDALSTDPDIRVVVLSGAGPKAFTAGLDVEAASQSVLFNGSSDPARNAVAIRRYVQEFQDAISSIERCEKRAPPPPFPPPPLSSFSPESLARKERKLRYK